MGEWHDRVKEELADLHQKARKLEHFINHVEVPSLTETQRGLLNAQLSVMNAYIAILALRLLDHRG